MADKASSKENRGAKPQSKARKESSSSLHKKLTPESFVGKTSTTKPKTTSKQNSKNNKDNHTKVNFSRYRNTASFKTDRGLWEEFKGRVKARGQDVCFVLNGLIRAYLESDSVARTVRLEQSQSQAQAVNIVLHVHNHYVVDKPRRRKPITTVMASYEGQLCQRCRLRPATKLDLFEDETQLLLCETCHTTILHSPLRIVGSQELKVYKSNTIHIEKVHVDSASASREGADSNG